MIRRLRTSIVGLVVLGSTSMAALAMGVPALAVPPDAASTGLSVGAVSGGIAADGESASTPASLARERAAARHGLVGATRYDWKAIAPARLPDGTSTRSLESSVAGISNSGEVTGNVSRPGGLDPTPFIASGQRSRWLDQSGLPNGAYATAISPAGQVVGKMRGIDSFYVSWPVRGKRTLTATPESYYGPYPGAVNSAGTVVGILASIKNSSLFYSARGRVTQVSAPKQANFAVNGISEGGVAVGTADHPSYRMDLRYPEGVIFTAARAQLVKADDTSRAEAISPNGRYVVGRVGVTGFDTGGRAAWLSTTRKPVILDRSAGLLPRDVSNEGVVVGAVNGHAATWQRGALTDLNRRVRNLPSGWVLTDAVAISHGGGLAVDAKSASGTTVALKLTPR
ncbi:MAG: hypothetical protein Q4P32_07440 [Micrococcales bacterium]|nr:hypothetical protein [Micrococcales bacterium]